MAWFFTAISGAAIGVVVAILLAHRAAWIDRQNLCIVLAREILLIKRRVTTLAADKAQDRRLITQDDMIVFRSNTGKLAVMESAVIFRVLKFYGFVRDLIAVQDAHKASDDFFRRSDFQAVATSVVSYAEAGAKAVDPKDGLINVLEAYGQLGFWTWHWLSLTHQVRKHLGIDDEAA